MSLRLGAHLRSVSFAALALAGAAPAFADPLPINLPATEEFFGFRPGTGTAISGAAATAQNSFMLNMVQTSTYGFEQNLPNPVPGFIMSNPDNSSNTVTVGGSARMGDAASLANGRFNTTSGGSRWLDIVGNVVTFTFEDPFAAIAMFITDIGDFETSVVFSLRNSSNGDLTTFDLGSRSGSQTDQNLAFWGFLDRSGATYDRLTITTRFAQADRFGIDDIVLGIPTTGQGQIPVPGTLALAAAALALMTLRRRA